MNILAEKYRPKKREDIVGNKNTIDSIFALADTGKLTHMIFEGPPGVGKTTTAHVLARQMFGEFFQSNFLELNASDSRKVDDVRSTIKTFSKTTPFGANFKICLLDEGDEMTSTAQNALRRTMEQYSEITIFIFAVNNAYKMIDAIQSRCQMFHFGPLSLGNIVLRLINIYKKELDAEGYMRELARRIQALRKKAGLHKEQHIALFMQADKKLIDLIRAQQELLAKKVGARTFACDDKPQQAVSQWSEDFKIKDFEGKIEFSVL